MPSLSWSAFVLRLDGHEMTGSGNSICSRITGWSGSHSVSPVVVCLRPTAAMMSPVRTASMSSRWLACICRSRPTRSLRPFVALMTPEPVSSVPE